MKISLTFIASFHHVKNWIISSAQDIFYLGLEQRSLISELIWRRHCLWKVHTSLNQTAKPALLLRAAWSGYKQFFDKQHQLREELEFKIFRKISVQTKSYNFLVQMWGSHTLQYILYSHKLCGVHMHCSAHICGVHSSHTSFRTDVVFI